MWYSILILSIVLAIMASEPRQYVRTTLVEGTIFIKGDNFNGYIFPTGYLWYPYDEITEEFEYRYPFAMTSYTPTISDVYRAENIIETQLKDFAIKENGDAPECLDHLEEYDRQYLGISKWGKYHILYVNLVSRKYQQSPQKSLLPNASIMTCSNCYMPAVVGGAPGEYTIEILVDLVNDKIILLNL